MKLAISASLDGVWVNFRNVTHGRMTSIYSVIDEVFEPLQAAMKSVVKIFRWREGLMEPSDRFAESDNIARSTERPGLKLAP